MDLPATDLVRLAMARTGAKGDAALARKLGLGPGGDKRVMRWRTGLNDPDYEGTLALLTVTQLLRPEADAPLAADGADGASSPSTDAGDRPRSLEEAVQEIWDLNVDNFRKVNASLADLRRRVGRLEKRLPPEVEQRSGSGR